MAKILGSALAIAMTVLVLAAQGVFAKDPAQGWMSYATASCPAGKRITSYEAKWKVGPAPPQGQAFFSPWIGMDTTDNLNLLQPVNPWMGSSWSAYTEYFEWDNFYNQNSKSIGVNPGDILHGTLDFNGEAKQSYTIVQTDTTTGSQSSQTQAVEVDSSTGMHKNYTILYIVYEKTWPCSAYPSSEEVTFYDIKVECDGEAFSPAWTTSYVDDNCDNRAHVISPTQVQITWNTTSPNSKYTMEEAVRKNGPIPDAWSKTKRH